MGLLIGTLARKSLRRLDLLRLQVQTADSLKSLVPKQRWNWKIYFIHVGFQTPYNERIAQPRR